MSPAIVWVGIAGAIGGLLAGLVLAPRLATLAHRYKDEVDVRPMSFRWVPGVAALAAGLVGAAQTSVSGILQGLVYAALTVPLIALAAIDLDVHRLPDRWTGPTFAATIVGLLLISAVRAQWHPFLIAIYCAIAVGLFYLIFALISGGQGFGLGDVKLAPTIGLLLGYNGALQTVLGVCAGFLSGGILAIALLVLRRANRQTAISFGPHMILGALVVLALPLVGAISQH